MKRLTFAVLALVAPSVGTDARAAPAGASCATAIPTVYDTPYTTDTTGTTNWMTSFGPLVSPSNDQLYSYVAGPQPLDPITPNTSNYAFAMYLIPSCSDSGTEPSPIRATGTLGVGMDLNTGSPPIVEGTTYYIAITGAASGGSTANGTLGWDTGVFIAVTLQNFTIE
ncbi:MAG TPA: hypothetical protein VFV97_17060 [Rhodanobacteraceae bacterium]|nr:hypothetical protein [Rhodanobacteraceae bacterium]